MASSYIHDHLSSLVKPVATLGMSITIKRKSSRRGRDCLTLMGYGAGASLSRHDSDTQDGRGPSVPQRPSLVEQLRGNCDVVHALALPSREKAGCMNTPSSAW